VPLGALPVPPCPSPVDPEYGLVKEKAVAIGGGPVYMAARQRRFIESLRGPAGEAVRVEGGVGSAPLDPGATGGSTIIDSYTVVYDGPDGAVRTTLYFDAYHFTAPRVPAGFTCGAPLAAVGVPPADPFRAGPQAAALAIELGPDIEVTPIPLVSGAGTHGALFDGFAVLALRARAAAEAGAPLDPDDPPRSPPLAPMTLLAHRITCGGVSVSPVTLELVGVQGPVSGDGEPVRGEALRALLPGVAVPDGSVGQTFAIGQPSAVRIGYDGDCDGEASVTLPVTAEPPRFGANAQPALPPGIDEAEPVVYLQAILGPEGRFGRPLYLGGPPTLVPAALEAVGAWRAQPLRVNGAPIVSPVVLQVVFR